MFSFIQNIENAENRKLNKYSANMESNENKLNNLSIINFNAIRKYCQSNIANRGDASKMLEAALHQMDGIILDKPKI